MELEKIIEFCRALTGKMPISEGLECAYDVIPNDWYVRPGTPRLASRPLNCYLDDDCPVVNARTARQVLEDNGSRPGADDPVVAGLCWWNSLRGLSVMKLSLLPPECEMPIAAKCVRLMTEQLEDGWTVVSRRSG